MLVNIQLSTAGKTENGSQFEVFPLSVRPCTHPSWNACLDRGLIIFQPAAALQPASCGRIPGAAFHQWPGGGGWPQWLCMERDHDSAWAWTIASLERTDRLFICSRWINQKTVSGRAHLTEATWESSASMMLFILAASVWTFFFSSYLIEKMCLSSVCSSRTCRWSNATSPHKDKCPL